MSGDAQTAQDPARDDGNLNRWDAVSLRALGPALLTRQLSRPRLTDALTGPNCQAPRRRLTEGQPAPAHRQNRI